MQPIRVKTVQESDLRMLGDLARNIQRVLPVTQADIDAAAALGKGWVVWKVFEVSEPLDNMRGGTQLIIRQNSITPGQNVRRVIFVVGPGGQTVVIRGTDYIVLPDAIANSLSYVKAFGGTEQGLLGGYTPLEYIESDGTQYIDPQVTGDARWVITAQANAVKGSSQSLISSTSGANGGTWYGEFTNTGHWDVVSGGTNIPPTTKITADLTFDGNGVRGTIGSTSVDRSTTVTQGDWRIFVTIGGSFPFAGKLFDAKVYQGGVLVRNFIPAKDSNNVVGLYDTVSGTFFTNGGTGDFIAGPTATPTPDAPMNIVSNNGVLKARHQSGLPLGYTMLDYIESNGTQYIDLGIKGNGNTKVDVKFKYHTATSTTGSGRVFGSRITSQNDAFAIGTSSGIVSATTNKVFWCYDGQSYFVVDENFGVDVWKTVVFSATEHSVDGVSVGDDYNVVEFETPYNLKLFGFDNNGTMGVGYVDVAYCKVWDNGVLIRDLVPAKNSSNVIGMYDRANDQFYTNDGTGNFVAGSTVSDPVEVYADGTVETIEDTIGNTATAEMLLKVGNYQDEQEILSGAVTRNVGIKVFDGTESFSSSILTGCWSLTNSLGVGNFTDRTVYCTHFNHSATLPPSSDRQGYALIGNYGSNYTVGFGVTTQFPTQEQFQQYLADQYAAGTPVIIVYPLATQTTETVTGQTLQVTDGDNVLEITQASLTGLELEAEYQAAVSLTIQEVQDANLDPNVQVTIN